MQISQAALGQKKLKDRTQRRRLSQVVFYGSLATTILIWASTLKDTSFITQDPFLVLSKISILTGTIAMCWTFILATRWSILEYILGGLEHVYYVHKQVGMFAFSAIVAHVFFQCMRFVPHWASVLDLFLPSAGFAVQCGVYAFILFLILIALTMWIRIPYHLWKKTHELFIVVLVLGFLHMFFLNRHVHASLLLSIWMYGFMVLAFVAYIYIRFLYYYIGPKYLYRITRIEQLRTTWNVYLEPEESALSYMPGQFAYLSFENKELGEEVHPYSFSSNPYDHYIRFSIKELGDWSKRMHYVRLGQKVTMWGPYGKFFEKYLYENQRDAVMIAGGIGVTPFLSLLGHEAHQASKRKSYLFYTVKNAQRADFCDEIHHFAHMNSSIIPRVHCTESCGFLSMCEVEDLVGDLKTKNIFLCGPPVMMKVFTKQLLDLGVKPRNIITEHFDLV